VPFELGLLTFLRQFKEQVTRQLLSRTSQYINSLIQHNGSIPSKTLELPIEVVTLMALSSDMVRFGQLAPSFFLPGLPDFLRDQVHNYNHAVK